MDDYEQVTVVHRAIGSTTFITLRFLQLSGLSKVGAAGHLLHDLGWLQLNCINTELGFTDNFVRIW